MGLPCMQCNESFSTRHTFESAVYDEGVYYFCGIECMEMWMSANAQEIEREKQQTLFEAPATGDLPRLELLDELIKDPTRGFSTEALEGLSKLLELKLLDFGVTAEVVAVYP